jgi:hypothetical protein
MSKLFNLIDQLPKEIKDHIFEYNPDHRQKMYWVLKDIVDIQYCEVCNKIIIKNIYCLRNSDMICCSMECVDQY